MATTTASGKKHIYLNNKNLEELIFNYRKNNRKYEQTMYESVYKLGTNFINQFKFLGYPQQVKEDMLQTFLFNFFNSINKGKFSIRKKNTLITIKERRFLQDDLKEYAGKKVYCAEVDKFNLYCYLIVDTETDTTKKAIVNVRLNQSDFKDIEVIYDTQKEITLTYDEISFNYFSFLTQIAYNSFIQVINSENLNNNVNQVVKFFNCDNIHEFDISDVAKQEKILSMIKVIQKNRGVENE